MGAVSTAITINLERSQKLPVIQPAQRRVATLIFGVHIRVQHFGTCALGRNISRHQSRVDGIIELHARRVRAAAPTHSDPRPTQSRACPITAQTSSSQVQDGQFGCSVHARGWPACSRLQANSARSCVRHATSSIRSPRRSCTWQAVCTNPYW